jgi:hypothetical protein
VPLRWVAVLPVVLFFVLFSFVAVFFYYNEATVTK